MPGNNSIPTLTISRRAVDLIIREEIGTPEAYTRLHSRPSWPGGASGVTIGIGYDLGYNTKALIRQDWAGRLKEDHLQMLMACSGITGQKAKEYCASPGLRTVNVPYADAYKVFVRNTLPRYAKATVVAFPGVELLMPDAAGALVSLVFNRGQRMRDLGEKENKEQARREMRIIAAAVPQKQYEAIATALISMKRLWDGVPDFDGDKEPKLGGVMRRRDGEAALVRGAQRQYNDDELINIPL